MNIVSSKQKAALRRLVETNDPQAPHASEILECVDRGLMPSPEAVEWLIEWIRSGARGAA